MWRYLRYVKSKNIAFTGNFKLFKNGYATAPPQSGKPGKTIFTLVAITGISAGSIIVYGKYDPKFRKMVEENIPYSDLVFKSVLDQEPSKDSRPPVAQPVTSTQKVKETAIEAGLLKKKQDRLKQEQKPTLEAESKPQQVAEQKEHKESEAIPAVSKSVMLDEKTTKKELSEQTESVKTDQNVAETNVKKLLEKLDKSSKDAIQAQEAAVEAIRQYTTKLYQALELPEDAKDSDVWKQADSALSSKTSALYSASQKMSEANAVAESLKQEINKVRERGEASKSPIFLSGEETLHKIQNQLRSAKEKIAAVEAEAKTASEYKDLVNKSREQFKEELKIVLPKYLQKAKDQSMTEDELNLLIAHAHRRIEHLQKQLARQQVTEKQRIDEAVRQQKIEDERMTDSRIYAEINKQQKELEIAFQKRVVALRDEFEAEMRQQLRRQAAAHADHIQEVMHIQQQELERKYTVDLEEKLLHQKGIFISEISESMARLKGIENHLKARARLEDAAKKAQALWLACQAMKDAIKMNHSSNPNSLAKELAAVKEAAGESNVFLATILAGIPHEAIQRGVYNDELLKQRFQHVNRICRRVAMIGENGGSLYRYLLSYLQSFLILDTVHIPHEELEGKVAVDPSEWDTFDILSRVSYCLQKDDLEQALRYANQLKGEPRNVARDWISEVRLLLETKQAVDSLIAHAASISIQAYH